MEVLKYLKRLSLTVALTAVLSAVVFYGPQIHPLDRSPERVASHDLLFVAENKDSGEIKNLHTCTSTAIGPHTVLTALHCIYGAYPTVRLDLSPVVYHIDGAMMDGREHVILHFSDVTFKYYVSISQRSPKMGEKIRAYGFGGGDYPAHAYYGKVIPDGYAGDLSDIDDYIGTFQFSFPVIGGDSGAAIFGEDGALVGVVSYSRGDEEDKDHFGGGCTTAFTPEQLEKTKF